MSRRRSENVDSAANREGLRIDSDYDDENAWSGIGHRKRKHLRREHRWLKKRDSEQVIAFRPAVISIRNLVRVARSSI
jgi:hypothetical protein